MEVWISLATVLVGALATGILTYVNVRSRSRAELHETEQRLLADRRLPYYQRLFQISAIIAEEPRSAENTWRSNPRDAVQVLQNWYFVDGAGMFLTDAARKKFFALIKALRKGLSPPDVMRPMSEEEVRQICELAERLRQQLTQDVAVSQELRMGAADTAVAERA
ncbi:hypothetical protein [Geodermatophilus sp. SYSU D00766]